jgi:hypothetical protein
VATEWCVHAASLTPSCPSCSFALLLRLAVGGKKKKKNGPRPAPAPPPPHSFVSPPLCAAGSRASPWRR